MRAGYLDNMLESMKHNKQNGFTLMEVLLSLAIIALITGILIPAYHTFQMRNDLEVAVNVTAQTLRRAQILSQAVNGGSDWGVYVQEKSITLFQGSSYDSRDSGFDEIFSISSALTLFGTQEFVYTSFSGLPQSTGTLTLSLNSDENRNITVNTKGTVDY